MPSLPPPRHLLPVYAVLAGVAGTAWVGAGLGSTPPAWFPQLPPVAYLASVVTLIGPPLWSAHQVTLRGAASWRLAGVLVVVQGALVAWVSTALFAATASQPDVVALLAAVTAGGALAAGGLWGWWRWVARAAADAGQWAPLVAGEIWWADIPFEEGRGSKDRPCLVLSSRGSRATVLMFTSQDKSQRADCLPVPPGVWRRPKESWLRLDRKITIPRSAMRRPEGRLDPATLQAVARHHHELLPR